MEDTCTRWSTGVMQRWTWCTRRGSCSLLRSTKRTFPDVVPTAAYCAIGQQARLVTLAHTNYKVYISPDTCKSFSRAHWLLSESDLSLKRHGAEAHAIHGPQLQFARIPHWLRPAVKTQTSALTPRDIDLHWNVSPQGCNSWAAQMFLPHKCSCQCAPKLPPQTFRRGHPGLSLSCLSELGSTHRSAPR